MPPYDPCITYRNPIDFNLDSGTYRGDASGGDCTTYPDIWPVVAIKEDPNDNLLLAAKFPLVGAIPIVSSSSYMTRASHLALLHTASVIVNLLLLMQPATQ